MTSQADPSHCDMMHYAVAAFQAQRAVETGKACLDRNKTKMSYIAPGDTASIKKQLTQHPHMLTLLQRAVGMQLVKPNETLPASAADYPRTSDGTVSVLVMVSQSKCCTAISATGTAHFCCTQLSQSQ